MNKQEFIEKYGESEYEEALNSVKQILDLTESFFDFENKQEALEFLRDANEKSDENDAKLEDALDIYETFLEE